jgi:hypothetical protein
LVKVHKRKSNTKISVETWRARINNSPDILPWIYKIRKKYKTGDIQRSYKQPVLLAGVFNVSINNNFACHPVWAKWLFYGSTAI